jgi:hypothetical protein
MDIYRNESKFFPGLWLSFLLPRGASLGRRGETKSVEKADDFGDDVSLFVVCCDVVPRGAMRGRGDSQTLKVWRLPSQSRVTVADVVVNVVV